MTAHHLNLPSGLVAYVDPTLLPDDLVEVLAAHQAIVISRASGTEATIHLDDEERVVRVDRHEAPPLAPVGDLDTARRRRRDRARATFQGVGYGVLAMAPAVATVPPVVSF